MSKANLDFTSRSAILKGATAAAAIRVLAAPALATGSDAELLSQ